MASYMKTREFSIYLNNLNYEDSISFDIVEEYLEQDLEVPLEFVESLHIEDTNVNIKLNSSREYFNDDWYINLQRVV